jgi:hypothetical protein
MTSETREEEGKKLLKALKKKTRQLAKKKPAVRLKTSRTKSRRSTKTKSSKKTWFHTKKTSGWKKDMPQKERRKVVLKSTHGDLLAAARGKQALANVSQDKETQVEAGKDAKYFYTQYALSKGK